ncbi:hypothetical protein BC940DRAFT_330327 [Gongronella butleri]|nr:hypothetical protein BC940DRAFT_330327 [Gongronella butleri]
MSDGRCIHCGQKGHYSMMCPKKPNSAHLDGFGSLKHPHAVFVVSLHTHRSTTPSSRSNALRSVPRA